MANWRNSLNPTRLDKTSGESEGIAWEAAQVDEEKNSVSVIEMTRFYLAIVNEVLKEDQQRREYNQ